MKINKIIFSLTIVLASLFSEIAAQGVISGPKKKTESIASTQQTQNKSTSRKSVSLSEPDGYINGHGYVDLGLPSGVKWATYNIGASNSWHKGMEFRWGALQPGEKGSPTPYGEYINIARNPQFDVATNNWGNSWFIPSKDIMEELVNFCKWEYVKYKGCLGYKISRGNKSIFLPVTNNNGSYCRGDYWTSTQSNSVHIYYLGFFKNGIDFSTNTNMAQMCIRPVCYN